MLRLRLSSGVWPAVVLCSTCLLLGGCGGGSDNPETPDVGLEHLTPRESREPRDPPRSTTSTTSTTTESEPSTVERQRLGTSVEGRPITAYRIGVPTATAAMLVVGCVHGTEPAGIAITERLRKVEPPEGVALWLVDEFNPDGCAAGTRQNANGVDLNRNSAWNWEPIESPGDTYYSGTGPLSEPESVVINEFVRATAPEISIWYHQYAELVDRSGGDPAIESRYARLVGLPYEQFGRPPGSITSWQNDVFPDDTAFIVELPAGPLSSESVRVHADAAIALAEDLAALRAP